MVIMTSSKVLSYYKDSDRPKFIQVVHSNGQVDLFHYLRNGHVVKTVVKKPKKNIFRPLGVFR